MRLDEVGGTLLKLCGLYNAPTTTLDDQAIRTATLRRRMAAADSALITKTVYRQVQLDDPAQLAGAIAWWQALTEAGGEGMVVKPLSYLTRRRRGLLQPAIKCRGREYLRIIYGPDYDRPENLDRLRKRGLGLKRQLAICKLALGLEALHCFVERTPLNRVHQCAFGVLAMESEAVDPRL